MINRAGLGALSCVLVLLSANAAEQGEAGTSRSRGDVVTPFGFPDCSCLPAGVVEEKLNSTGYVHNGCLSSPYVPGVCLPLDYGQGHCGRWDSGGLACDAFDGVDSPRPDWCDYEWCYVDKIHCTRPNTQTSYFPNAGLSYSYATCGYVDTFTLRVVSSTLKDVSIRVSYPPNNYWMTHTYPNGTHAGALHYLFKTVVDKWNITVTEVPIPEVSLSQFPGSTYTACVHAIALNSTDMCVGGFWITRERLTMTSYSIVVANAAFYLVSRVDAETESFASYLGRPFIPFTPLLWCVITLLVALMSLAYAWVEPWGFEEGYTVGERVRGMASETDQPQRTCRTWPRAFSPRRLLNLFQQSVQSSLEGGWLLSPETPGGKMIVTGFCFLILILLTSYTANLTAQIVNVKSVVEFASLDDVISRQAKVCADPVLAKALVATHPGLNNLLVTAYDKTGLISAMDKGLCSVVVTDLDSFTYGRTINNTCDKVMVGPAILVYGGAVPMKAELVQGFNTELVQIIGQGTWAQIVSEHQEMFPPPETTCSDSGSPMDPDEGKLGVVHFAGAIFIYLCFLVGGVVLEVVRRFTQSKPSKLRREESMKSPETLSVGLSHGDAIPAA